MEPEVVDLIARLAADSAAGPVWTQTSADLNLNLVRVTGSHRVPAHVNAEVDVLILGVSGEGIVEVNGVERRLGPQAVCLIPKGAERAIRSVDGPFAYLTCHRRRGGLWPAD